MGYKDLLVVLDPTRAGRRRIELAAALAGRFDAHLAGLYPLPMAEVSRAVEYYNPALLDPLLRRLADNSREAAELLRTEFEETARRHGISFEWRSPNGQSETDPAIHARYADLTIVGQPDPDRSPGEVAGPPPETVALASGRPILAIPYAGEFPTLGRRVLIAWNAGREAARAVNDAMPLLTAAEKVTVLVVDPHQGPKGHGEVPGADISLHLARHGVKAEVERTVAGEVAIGDVLLSRAADLGADLLVMGAYGHSRARELLLGGATRSILHTMTLPVLMAH
jgi:nucleotide-binding universal stress UspA family protein